MKTDELISLLATSAEPVQSHAAARRFGKALGCGLFAAAALMVLTLGVRPDITEAVFSLMFWLKLGFAALVATVALYTASHLGRPGMRIKHAPALLGALLAGLWILAGIEMMSAPPGARRDLLLGESWWFCMLAIPVLSIPVFAAAMWALKGLAPTRPALAGAAAGLLAGAASATIYALHCPESSAAFLAIWYVAGMLISTLAGALLGQRLLQW